MRRFVVKVLSFFIRDQIRRKNFRHIWGAGNKGSLSVKGKNNQIFLDVNGVLKNLTYPLAGLHLCVNGHFNKIVLSWPLDFKDSFITIEGNENIFQMKSSVVGIKKCHIYLKYGATVNIGRNFCAANGLHVYVNEEEKMALNIGDDCLIAPNVIIRTSDSHTILDHKTNRILNKGKDIVIKNRVWICEGVTLLKGTELQDDTIVATKSVVSKPFYEKNVIIAGIPGKCVKKNIRWDIRQIPIYLQQENKH